MTKKFGYPVCPECDSGDVDEEAVYFSADHAWRLLRCSNCGQSVQAVFDLAYTNVLAQD